MPTSQFSPIRLGGETHKAVFLDRDGVLIEDVHLLRHPDDIRILTGVPQALQQLKVAGFSLVVVSNQTVVARGLLSEDEVVRLHWQVLHRLELSGAPSLDGFYFCPHHPNATIHTYRVDCDCRKPQPGLLLRAAREQGIDLSASYLIGDRTTDIMAGASAGCGTVLVHTGAHMAPPIEFHEPMDSIHPDYTCAALGHASQWILEMQ